MSQSTYTDLSGMSFEGPHWYHLSTENSFFDEDRKLSIKTKPRLEELNEIGDLGLLDLAKTAEETGDLMPLIKEELKCKIQAKRLATGREELTVNDEKPTVCQLTADDIRRRETRRAQNRRAAKKYRIKQRTILSADKQDKIRLQEENANLLSELNQLQLDKQYLLDLLHLHQRECTADVREAVVPNWSTDLLPFS